MAWKFCASLINITIFVKQRHCECKKIYACHLSAIFILLLSILLCISCTNEWQGESLDFRENTELDVVKKHDSITSLQGGISLDFEDKVLWVFGETRLKEENSEGQSELSNSAAWVLSDSITENTEFSFIENDSQQLTQFIPYNTDENQYNANNTGHILLLPLGGFVHENIGYIYYKKLEITGFLLQLNLGIGIAQVDSNGNITRLSPALFDDPTLF